jgi:hypothetical protein
MRDALMIKRQKTIDQRFESPRSDAEQLIPGTSSLSPIGSADSSSSEHVDCPVNVAVEDDNSDGDNLSDDSVATLDIADLSQNTIPPITTPRSSSRCSEAQRFWSMSDQLRTLCRNWLWFLPSGEIGPILHPDGVVARDPGVIPALQLPLQNIKDALGPAFEAYVCIETHVCQLFLERGATSSHSEPLLLDNDFRDANDVPISNSMLRLHSWDDFEPHHDDLGCSVLSRYFFSEDVWESSLGVVLRILFVRVPDALPSREWPREVAAVKVVAAARGLESLLAAAWAHASLPCLLSLEGTGQRT